MKKIMFLLLAICSASMAFSQFDYPKEAFSAADMNLKGKVKKLTETHVTTDKNGKIDKDEPGLKIVYDFDERGNITKIEGFDIEENESIAIVKYEYVNGKLNKVVDIAEEGNSLFYSYSQSVMTVKNAAGSVVEIHTLKNGRVSEVKTFPKDKTTNGYLDIYEYNSNGQIEKQTHKYGEGYSSSFLSKYSYNPQGDFIKQEKHRDGKLSSTWSYEYKYDKNKNWTKCIAVSYLAGDEDDKDYELFTRTCEYY